MATKKIPFRTLLDDPVEISTASGEEIENVIALKIDENGKEDFYVEGQTNVYEKIQADADLVNIEKILSRVIATGDYTLLNQKKGEFLDLTETPTSLVEANMKIREAEKTFEQLPLKIRSEYNNDFNEYLADVGSEKWLELTGLKEKEVKVESIPEEKGEATE